MEKKEEVYDIRWLIFPLQCKGRCRELSVVYLARYLLLTNSIDHAHGILFVDTVSITHGGMETTLVCNNELQCLGKLNE